MLSLRYTPHIWPFVASLAITLALGAYAWRRRHLPRAPTFALLMLALSVWTSCYLMELLSPTLEAKRLWAAAKYLGGTTGPVAWFVLALQLTRNQRWLTPLVQLLLAAFVITTVFVVFTNEAHHWYWKEVFLVPGEPETQATRGFFFWIYAAALYIFVLTSVFLFVGYYRSTPPFYRKQAALMALGGFLPLAGRLLEDFFQVDLFPQVDNVILLLLMSGLLFAAGIFGYRALDIVHIAHSLVIRNISAGIVVLDTARRVVELNPYARSLVPPSELEPVGQPLSALLPDWPELDVEGLAEEEVSVVQEGKERWFRVQTSRILAENGQPAGYALALFDITARKEAQRQLEALARTDPLTGAANRRHFRELAEAELARAVRHGRSLALLLLDVDHFKKVNDTCGHQAGDEVLRMVAARCQARLRTVDLFGRYGGEEFVALLGEGTLEDARGAAERIRRSLQEADLTVDGQRIAVTASIGLAFLPPGQAASLDELVQRADEALYAAKSGGRNRVELWSAGGVDAGARPG